jgi:hypothetical protein
MQAQRTIQIFATALAVTIGAALPAAAATPSNIRGTVAAMTATTLTVKTAAGTVTLALTPKTGFASASAAKVADITPNAFLGIASVPYGKTSKALEVTIFPESMRGLGEGDYPWDLNAAASHSSMTNGAVAHSSMTNGSSHSMMTNGAVSAKGGTTLTMTYKGGTRTIVVPPNAPIVKLAPGSSKLLAPNAPDFVIPASTPKGPAAAFVVVGVNGAVPPM